MRPELYLTLTVPGSYTERSAGRGKHCFDEEGGLFHYTHLTNGMAFSRDIFTNPGYTDLGGNSYSYMHS